MTGERKIGDGILPPGVQKGSDFFKPETIEARAEARAARVRAKMPETIADLLIIDKSKLYFFDLPSLDDETGKMAPIWVPRFHPNTGAIVTSRWNEPKTLIKPGGQALADPERYEIIRKPQYRKNITLSSFPKNWCVSQLVPQEIWDGIEAAMRQMDEVGYDYGTSSGVEQKGVEELLVGIHSLSDVFKERRITHADLENISEETESMLDSMGLLSARKSIKQNLTQRLIMASHEDSKNRVNPLISRARLSAAYLDTVKREVVSRLVREKAGKAYDLMYIERDETRTLLSETSNSIGYLLDENPVFLNPESFRSRRDLSDEEITGLVNSLRSLAGSTLANIRVAPYLAPASISRVFITDVNYLSAKDRLRIEGVLEEVNSQDILNTISAEEWIKRRNPSEAVKCLEIARTVTNEVLGDTDYQDYTVFSDVR